MNARVVLTFNGKEQRCLTQELGVARGGSVGEGRTEGDGFGNLCIGGVLV